MKKFISRKVYDVLFKKAKLQFPENYSYERDILNFVEYESIMEIFTQLLKRGVLFQYLIKQRLSDTMKEMYINNDFKSPYSTYDYFFYMSDSSVMCPNCFNQQIKLVNGDFYNVNFICEGIDNNFENDSLYCDFCSERIEEAYPADKKDDN